MKKYYNLEGYPCSREEVERELKTFKQCIPRVNSLNLKFPIIYGTK